MQSHAMLRGRNSVSGTYDFRLLESQSSGRLIPGRGHTGHVTASSPGTVPAVPVVWWARPNRFIIFRYRHSRIIVKNDLYRD